MNDTTLLPDDPRLTAYALGELEGAERAAVEAALRDDPTARAVVQEIRATAARLEAALAEEATESPAGSRLAPKDDPYARNQGAKLLRFPQIYFIVGGLAAACFAIMAALRTPPPTPAGESRAKASGATETVLIDMSALVRTAEPAKRTEEPATAVAAIPATAPRTLLEQSRDLGRSAAGDAPLNLQLSPSTVPPLTVASAAGSTLIGPLGQASKDAATKIQPASGAGEGRVLMHAPDEKFVVEVRPRNSATASAGAGPGLAPSGGGAIFNESRGLPGASLGEVTKGTSFAEANAPAAEPAKSGGGGLLFLSPFTVSADRFQGRVGASADVKANSPVMPARVPSPTEFTRGTVRLDRGATNTEAYAYAADNGFVSVAQHPVSTFSADADTASYANVRRFVQGGRRPPRDAVRIEELLNYFPYRYPAPAAKSDAPLATSLEVAAAPWAPTHRLVRIGLKGREVTTAERAAANLVFLIDVSGSMNAPNRLPLVKESLRMLLGKLRPDDRVAIVTYAGQSGLALPSTPVSRAREILTALDRLTPGGSTNGAMGIQLAYDIAKANLVSGGINRVILCTDGDFNVGVTSEGELVRLIREKAQSGVWLTVLGFGMGNLKDSTLEKLADHGNGHYGYIDSRQEAEKLLGQQVNGTLVTIAKDVKIQVEFNPAQVESYRLIGYENRMLRTEDFKNDQVDAGEIGAGHTVTALYEIIPAGAGGKASRREPEVEERRYNIYSGVTDNATGPGRTNPNGKELLTVRVRYKKPDGVFSRRLDFPLMDAGGTFGNASVDFKFAAAVAGYGMILRESPHRGTATMANVIEWAEAGTGDDAGGYRSEFIELARQADALEK